MEPRKPNPFRFPCSILHVLALAAFLPAILSAQSTSTIGFNTDGGVQGFTAYSNASATFSVSIAGGLLTGTSPGGDPRLIRNSSTPIATKPAAASWTTVKFRVREKDDASATVLNAFSAAWNRLFDYSATKPLVMSVGIIGNSLETPYSIYATSIRQIHDAGSVEFWNHGYLHVRDQPAGTSEFRGTTYAYQLSNFQTTQTLAREKLGFPFTTFGSPFNANDAVTWQVLETDPDMQTSFFGTAAFGPTDSRLLNLNLPWLNIEVSTGNLLDYNTFVTNYSAKKNQPYLVLQGHPGGWDPTEFEIFNSFVDYLIADGVTFMTPSGYRARMDTDNDGVPDVIERVLGRNPALAEYTPPVSLDLSESRVVFEVAAGQAARLRLALESFNDMNTWAKTPISAGFITTLPDGRRRVEVPLSPGAERSFWRLSESSDGVSTWP